MKVLRNTLPCFPRPDVGHCRAAWLGLACQGFQSWFSLAKRETCFRPSNSCFFDAFEYTNKHQKAPAGWSTSIFEAIYFGRTKALRSFAQDRKGGNHPLMRRRAVTSVWLKHVQTKATSRGSVFFLPICL